MPHGLGFSGLLRSLRVSAGRCSAEALYLLLRVNSKPPVSEGSTNTSLTHEELLRSILRRFPYWAAGHLRLSLGQLQAKDQPGAYVSVRAAMALRGDRDSAVRHHLARVYLQSGREGDAEKILEKLVDEEPTFAEAREDLAAAYLHFQKYEAAKEQLMQIPVSQRSPGARATLQFLQSR